MVTLEYSSEYVCDEQSITEWRRHRPDLNRNGPNDNKTNRIFCWLHILQRELPKWMEQNKVLDGSMPPGNYIAFLAEESEQTSKLAVIFFSSSTAL